MRGDRSQSKDSLVHGCDMVLIGAAPRNLCSNHGEDKVGDKPLGCGGAAGGV